MSPVLTRPLAALTLTLSALLVACGGGDAPGASTSATATAAAAPVAAASADAGAAAALNGLRRRTLALQAAAVPPAVAASQLMDFAEAQFPTFFPGPVATVQAAPFVYRHYPATGAYLVVVTAAGTPYVEQGVYLLGGAFGDAPVFVGRVSDFIVPEETRISMALASSKAVVMQGGSASTAITLTRASGFAAGAQVQVDGLPAGVTARPLVVAEGATTATLVLDAAATAPHSLPTSTTVTLRAADAELTQSLDVTVRGAAGTVDTSFGGGVVVTPVGVSEDYANAVAVQADGKVLVAGSTATSQGTQFSVVRHLRDGGLDASFGQGGKVVLPMGPRGNDVVAAIAVQPDGRIVLAGSSDQGASGMDFALLRLLPDGQPDPSFGAGGKVIVDFFGGTDRARAIALLPDGRIVAGGEAHSGAAGGLDFALLQLQTDGTPDAGFGTGGRVVTAIRSGGSSELIRGLALPVVDGEQRILAVGGEGDFMAVRYRAAWPRPGAARRCGWPARSATVRATFSARCSRGPTSPGARRRCAGSQAWASSARQWVSISPGVQQGVGQPWRACCRAWAAATRAATMALGSPSGWASRASAGTAGTSTCRSMRSSSGPDSLPW
jgi:uncharacterized delta-60 repeat protein